MFPSEVLAEFEQRTGIAVNYANFDYGENMLTKLQAVNGGEYDLVIADDYIIEMAIAQGLAQPLDKAQLSNYGNINPLYQGQFYDPGDLYTVPYGAGVQTIVYNPAAVTKPIAGYADLWDASLKGMLGVVGNFRVINGMALKVLGQSYNTEDLVQIRAAGDKLLELAPNIRLIKDDNLQDDLVMGEINAAVMYTSQVTMAKLAMPELEVVYPAEGIGFGIMAGFIPSQAPSAEAAHLFLNYLLEPEVAAQCFEWLGYYCTTEAAEPYIAEEFRSFLTLPEGFSLEMEMIQNIGTEAMDLHAEIFTEFKTACGQ
ncbi:MAG: spermidine/putrescine ABC transporter substrate-binding protein [Clostridiales bacterium]|nr:spermidine/putrescine ABC transporter substrate-binding protein [Clostridiales bacterium]